MNHHRNKLILGILAGAMVLGCSGSSDGSGGGGGGGAGGNVTENGLEETFPSDLSISSPYADGNAVEGLLKSKGPIFQNASGDTEFIPTDAVEFESLADRKTELTDRLDAKSESDCAFRLGLFRAKLDAACYGPSVAYINHPNGSSGECPGPNCDDGNFPGGDLGIWTEYESRPGLSDQPCVIAKIHSLLSEVKGKSDTAVDMFSAMLCFAKVSGKDDLPAEGDTLDLTETVASGMTTAGLPLTITEAKIERKTNPDASHASFVSTMNVTVTGPDSKTITMDMKLQHMPSLSDATYKGRLSYTLTGDAITQAGGNCNSISEDSELQGGAITYEKGSDTFAYQLRQARYCAAADARVFDDDGQLVANNVVSSGNHGGWADDFFDTRGSINTTDGTGDVGVAWQAGPMDPHTRVFTSSVALSDGEKSGCGYFGFGPDVSSSDLGNLDGMICNWVGPHGYISQDAGTRVSSFQTHFVQQQCVSYDKDASAWTSNAADLHIEYGPTNACTWLGGSSTLDGDGTARTNELFDASALTLAIPTAPTL